MNVLINFSRLSAVHVPDSGRLLISPAMAGGRPGEISVLASCCVLGGLRGFDAVRLVRARGREGAVD